MQALNNWGLVLQELIALRPASERQFLVSAATAKFRRAIRLRPEFDRGNNRIGPDCWSRRSWCWSCWPGWWCQCRPALRVLMYDLSIAY